MEVGINTTNPKTIKSDKYKVPVQGWPGKTNEGKGTTYYFALHFTLALLILAVIIGNVGMFLGKRRSI